EALYKASQAGVQIDLLVRGMCCLRPELKGVSDRIRVRSVVGRFLEHSRIFFFQNCGAEQIYIGSADCMPPNLYDPLETLVPIHDPRLKARIRQEILDAYLMDNAKARIMRSDGTYVRATALAKKPAPARLFNAQEFLLEVAEGKKTIADLQETHAAPGPS